MDVNLPYGKSTLTIRLPNNIPVDLIEPNFVPPTQNPLAVVRSALDNLIGDVHWLDFSNARSVAIAVNDKTRPVPYNHLLPPLIEHLAYLGIPTEAVTFYIAVGSHPPIAQDEFISNLPEEIVNQFKVVSHNSEDGSSLVFLGQTSIGTPVWVNRDFFEADLKIVVGNIEPHQFMGFSGGVKTAAVGLGGLSTINANHALMVDPQSKLGSYETNPARQDLEEIGDLIGVQLALNAILNQDKHIVHVLAGMPRKVMEDGIPMSRKVCQIAVQDEYDLLIATPGGHPKDVNLYQSQKALFHASQVVRTGGRVIIAAACPEGIGSLHYEDWMSGMRTYDEIITRFIKEGFRIGAHKAFLIARDASRVNINFFSQLDMETANNMLLNPVSDLQGAVDEAFRNLKPGQRVGILTHASSTLPYIENLNRKL